jgi:hypothetical protein
MAAFGTATETKKLYPDMSQLIGSGQYKKVYGVSNDIKNPNVALLGIESDVSPENVVVAICGKSISNGIIGSRIIDEIILQNEFSRKTPQLAPLVYGVVVKTRAGTITTYAGEDLVAGSRINHAELTLSPGDLICIYQQRCDSDLSEHIKLNLSEIEKHHPDHKTSDTYNFIEEIHASIKTLFGNIVKSGYIGIDIKSGNICHFNGKVDLYGIDSAEPVNIGLDMDPAFTYPFEKKLREVTPPIEGLVKITSDFSEHATIFMLIEYYIVFTYMHKEHTHIVSRLLTTDGIGCPQIFEMLRFMKEMENPKYGNIFEYESERFTPIFMLKHYLSFNMKKGKSDEYDPWIKLNRMTLEELATKICESLGLLSNPNVGVFTSMSNKKDTSIKPAGSRRRRPRKMNSRKKHLNKRTHKTINARTSKSNSK